MQGEKEDSKDGSIGDDKSERESREKSDKEDKKKKKKVEKKSYQMVGDKVGANRMYVGWYQIKNSKQ